MSELKVEQKVFYLVKKYDLDIFVFPIYYHNESFPLVLLETMTYGLQVLSSDEGGFYDLVKNN